MDYERLIKALRKQRKVIVEDPHEARCFLYYLDQSDLSFCVSAELNGLGHTLIYLAVSGG